MKFQARLCTEDWNLEKKLLAKCLHIHTVYYFNSARYEIVGEDYSNIHNYVCIVG